MSKDSKKREGQGEVTTDTVLDLLRFTSEEEDNNSRDFVQDVQNFCSRTERDDLKDVRHLLNLRGQRNILLQKIQYQLLFNKYETLTGRIRAWNLLRNQVHRDLQHQNDLLQMNEVREDVMGVYSRELQALMISISSTPFSRPPKGPIGSCFSVKGEWKPLVEYILRPVIYTFLVHSHEDRTVLENLIDDIGGWPADYAQHPAVWVINFDSKPMEVDLCSTKEPDLVTVLNMLSINDKDKVVTRFLLENTNIHRILLFKTQHEAFPNLAEKNNLPKGCKVAYTLDLFKITPSPAFKSVRLDEEELNFDILPPGLAKTTSTVWTRSKLKKHEESVQELEQRLRAMKDIQQDMLSALLKRKDQLANFEQALNCIKTMPNPQLAVVLDQLINSSSTETKAVSIETLKDRFTKVLSELKTEK